MSSLTSFARNVAGLPLNVNLHKNPMLFPKLHGIKSAKPVSLAHFLLVHYWHCFASRSSLVHLVRLHTRSASIANLSRFSTSFASENSFHRRLSLLSSPTNSTSNVLLGTSSFCDGGLSVFGGRGV